MLKFSVFSNICDGTVKAENSIKLQRKNPISAKAWTAARGELKIRNIIMANTKKNPYGYYTT